METPDIVDKIKDTISERLGREAIVRKINNRDEYFILDLAFSYFQKADRNRRNDYRSGFLYLNSENSNQLIFVIAHSPIMIDFFSNNFDFVRFRDILIDTSGLRNEHFIRYSKSKDNQLKFKTDNFNELLDLIDNLDKNDFKKQVFTKSSKINSNEGNIFLVSIANNFEIDKIDEIIDKCWDLFMWLYPSKPIFKRNASLNRSLQKIDRQCEINRIDNVPNSIKIQQCQGQIEGAHIKPHKDGGSDKLENGVWLCNLHHRLTEGKLKGDRGLEKINVKFDDKNYVA